MPEMIAFLAGSAVLLWLSRKALRAPGGHGFYRFFAWEGILALLVLNHGPWGEDPFSPHQMLSWLLMLTSILLLVQGITHLRRQGNASRQRNDDDALYAFERTTALVTSGIYGHIRHPMYASLLALAWGAHFQNPAWTGVVIAGLASAFLLLTARADERECLAYFGEAYADYMKRTRRFVPGMF